METGNTSIVLALRSAGVLGSKTCFLFQKKGFGMKRPLVEKDRIFIKTRLVTWFWDPTTSGACGIPSRWSRGKCLRLLRDLKLETAPASLSPRGQRSFWPREVRSFGTSAGGTCSGRRQHRGWRGLTMSMPSRKTSSKNLGIVCSNGKLWKEPHHPQTIPRNYARGFGIPRLSCCLFHRSRVLLLAP